MIKGAKEPSGTTGRLRSFYDIHDNGDGTADIYFDRGTAFPSEDDPGQAGDILARVLKGIVIYTGMEEDIRRNYDKWYQDAEVLWL